MVQKYIVSLQLKGFDTMVRFIYSGEETIITSLQNLDLLFEIFRLADKVR